MVAGSTRSVKVTLRSKQVSRTSPRSNDDNLTFELCNQCHYMHDCLQHLLVVFWLVLATQQPGWQYSYTYVGSTVAAGSTTGSAVSELSHSTQVDALCPSGLCFSRCRAMKPVCNPTGSIWTFVLQMQTHAEHLCSVCMYLCMAGNTTHFGEHWKRAVAVMGAAQLIAS